ncbi:conserved membrane hypothetical protein [Vibrio crassostreae]|uniref:hypothetical protein n=1 Tax=Vibrio crassostreae TaxID=246167 RepID=UPI000F4AB3BD|nr:hypothetical protein [Vibrio crassostreae]ROR18994.1 hypothetical protein EDB36_101138 [Vibrio crassostreae]CAK1824384.1 conserved membrane hypothetical protein [Vibrio crassostreae]CAK2300948.1 conserved membrane hypothetical protein [Vibrio crassostreae]CAK2301073.1 conserved membrane hypothetical protein [Vibrio crassostreae]CAK3204566.1 conserved membrane hypothetical protein [Vibrio crassostreae]
MFSKKTNNKIVSVYEPMELPKEKPEDLAIEFDVIQLAKQQARKSEPSSQSKSPGHNEIMIRSEMNAKATQAISSVDQSLSSIRDEIDTLSLGKETNDVQEIVEEFRRKVDTEFTPLLKEIDNKKDEATQSYDELENFKSNNGLRRSAVYPDSSILTLGLLAIMVIIESAFNSSFFAAGSDLGLLGGIIEAGLISVINVSFGVFLGSMLLRNKNHINKFKSYTAIIAFTLALTIPVLFNLGVAHFREALLTNPDNAHLVAMSAIKNGILNITDVKSWMLFIVGMMCCMFAIFKGYGMDDAYPKFGKLSRRKIELDEELHEMYEDANDHLEGLHESYLETLDAKFEALVTKEKRVGHLSSAFEQQKRILVSYIRHLEDNLHYLIRLYRDTNSAEREDDSPIYFNDAICLEMPSEELDIKYNEKRYDVTNIREELSASLPDIRKEFLDIKKNMHECIGSKV